MIPDAALLGYSHHVGQLGKPFYGPHPLVLERLYLLVFPLCPGKLYAQTDYVADEYLGKNGKKAETEELPERCIGQFASGKIVLIAHIIHSKQHRWQQGYHHKAHDAFGVDGIMDACSACRGLVRNVQERVEAVVDALEGVQFSVRFKLRLDFIKIISE